MKTYINFRSREFNESRFSFLERKFMEAQETANDYNCKVKVYGLFYGSELRRLSRISKELKPAHCEARGDYTAAVFFVSPKK